ncbi:MAG: DUF1289 domain-containing protein [Brevundimonas sp.]|jgi:uncharacterized protein|uniref:DUF1289 domain-containing protein n=1 Tax=Brevundimonas sp. TaxID=1871086 RepID=UPI00391A42B7
MSTSPARPVLTPCIKVCAVDGESGLCLGCFRSLQEIAAWARYTDEERAIILDQLSARRQLISPEKLGLSAWPGARAN